jgi:hypothetical protein
MEREVLDVRIINEPQTQIFYTLAEKPVEIRDSFTCPHCDEKTNVTKKVFLSVYNTETGKCDTLVLPEKNAKEILSKAYNTLLMRITRAMNSKGFWAKVKALFTKKVINFPNPSNTFWTMKYDKDSDYENLEISAEVREKT